MHFNINLDEFNDLLDKAILDNDDIEIERLIVYFENHLNEFINHVTVKIRDESGNEFKRLKM